MKPKQLSVRLNGQPVGIFEQNIAGDLVFSYIESAAQAISLSMPIREEPFKNAICEAFFGGLLPESITAKKIIGKQYGISYNNTFALLKAIGYDCAGAISLHEINDPILTNKKVLLEGDIVSENNLYNHIKNLPQMPLFLDIAELRLSLAGAQDKAAVCLIDGQVAFPNNGCPTTHILKPAVPGFEGIVENEYLCLQTAAQIGLYAAPVEIRQIKDIKYLLIERYDRKITNNLIERIHQEDFCQALSIRSAHKYQNEGGPGIKECFQLIKNTTQPVNARNMLMAGIIFNFLIGNMDAHGKNFSLLYSNNVITNLAPFYDMLCTRFYPAITNKMAMKIGSKYEADRVLPRHWEQLCETIGYSYPAFKRLLIQQGNSILGVLEKNNESGITKNIITTINKNITRVLNQFEK